MLTAIETTATVGPDRQLILDEDLPDNVADKVRVIVLFPDGDFSESNWQKMVASSESFSFLNEEKELYSLKDGKPLVDEI